MGFTDPLGISPVHMRVLGNRMPSLAVHKPRMLGPDNKEQGTMPV